MTNPSGVHVDRGASAMAIRKTLSAA